MASSKVDDARSCGICMNAYDTDTFCPRILPCGHTLCTTCVTQLLTSASHLTCPFDKVQHAAVKAPGDAPKNFTLIDIITALGEVKTSDVKKLSLGGVIPNGKYILTAAHSRKAIVGSDGNVFQETFGKREDQALELKWVDAEYFTLTYREHLLAVEGSASDAIAPVVLLDSAPASIPSEALFSIQLFPESAEKFYIACKGTGKNLDVDLRLEDDGVRIIHYDKRPGALNQLFSFHPHIGGTRLLKPLRAFETPPIKEGLYLITSVRKPNGVIGAEKLCPEHPFKLLDQDKINNSVFHLTWRTPRHCTLKMHHSTDLMVHKVSDKPVLYKNAIVPLEDFLLEIEPIFPGADQFYIVDSKSRAYLHLAEDNSIVFSPHIPHKARQIFQFHAHNDSEVIFRPIAAEIPAHTANPIPEGDYYISVAHSDKVLDVQGISQSAGAHIFQYKFHGGKNQIFTLKWVLPQFCSLTAKHSGHVMDVKGKSLKDGAELIQYPCFTPPRGNQLFAIQPVAPGSKDFYIVCKDSGKVLEIPKASKEDRAPLTQYRRVENRPNQWFRFHPADTSKSLVAPLCAPPSPSPSK